MNTRSIFSRAFDACVRIKEWREDIAILCHWISSRLLENGCEERSKVIEDLHSETLPNNKSCHQRTVIISNHTILLRNLYQSNRQFKRCTKPCVLLLLGTQNYNNDLFGFNLAIPVNISALQMQPQLWTHASMIDQGPWLTRDKAFRMRWPIQATIRRKVAEPFLVARESVSIVSSDEGSSWVRIRAFADDLEVLARSLPQSESWVPGSQRRSFPPA